MKVIENSHLAPKQNPSDLWCQSFHVPPLWTFWCITLQTFIWAIYKWGRVHVHMHGHGWTRLYTHMHGHGWTRLYTHLCTFILPIGALFGLVVRSVLRNITHKVNTHMLYMLSTFVSLWRLHVSTFLLNMADPRNYIISVYQVSLHLRSAFSAALVNLWLHSFCDCPASSSWSHLPHLSPEVCFVLGTAHAIGSLVMDASRAGCMYSHKSLCLMVSQFSTQT